jgi:hypothetical protein
VEHTSFERSVQLLFFDGNDARHSKFVDLYAGFSMSIRIFEAVAVTVANYENADRKRCQDSYFVE